MLEAIGRNTRTLLDISGQLKSIMKTIEAIPLHLTLDIVRLDDAHGESWALPLQACRTWGSFCDLLRCVVYANERPGANRIMQNLFAVTHAKTGIQVGEETWVTAVKPGFHIEQAMIVKRPRPQICVNSTCIGRLVEQDSCKTCTTCGRLVTTHPAQSPMVALYQEQYSPTVSRVNSGVPRTTGPNIGPQLSSVDIEDKAETFRRVKVIYPKAPIPDIVDVWGRLDEDPFNPEANAFVGLDILRVAEQFLIPYAPESTEDDKETIEDARLSIKHLNIAIKSDKSNVEYIYLLGRAYMLVQDYKKALECFQKTTDIQPRCPSFWISIGILFFNTRQYEDSLEALARSVKLNSNIYETWYNLGVLYDSYNSHHEYAIEAFERCDYLKPGLPEVRARLEAYQVYSQDCNEELSYYSLIDNMIETPLRTQYEIADEDHKEGISSGSIYNNGLQG
ncbi:hypothetical protein FSHL1_002969 [Fusarium sambucinum]